MALPRNEKLVIVASKLIFDMDVRCGASCLQVKQKIKEFTNLKEERQTLVYENVTIADDTQVPDLAWAPSSSVVLRVAPLPGNPSFVIVAKSTNREDDLITVKETQSVDHLRNQIATRWGISPPTNITLLRFDATQMRDGHLLSDYLINEGVEIQLLLRNA